MNEFYSEKLKAKVRLIERDKDIFLKEIADKEIKDQFKYYMLSVEEIENEKPTLKQIVNFFEETIWSLIGGLKKNNSCVLQLYGELLPNELAEYFPMICTWDANSRFYLPEVKQSAKDEGYLYSWMSFEFNENTSKNVRLGYRSILKGFIVENESDKYFETFYMQKWTRNAALEGFLRSSIIFILLDYDCDFMDIITRLPMDEVIQRLKDGLQNYDRMKNTPE